MNAGWSGMLAGMPWAGILGFVIDISIKAAIVCAVAMLATLSMRRASAKARSMVWVFTLVILLALPLGRFVSPVWNLPVIPEVSTWFGRGADGVALVVPGDKPIDAPNERAFTAAGRTGSAAAGAGLADGWEASAILAWLAGAVLALCWLAVRTALGRRIIRRCEAADEAWADLLAETAARLGLNRRVRLFESCEIGAAVTVGAINPAIVVPAGSAEWPAAKRRYILSHELAHIKRRDGLVEVLAIVVKSVYWFNPFVWLAVKAARIERERDCDDAVLNAGARPSDYAMFLMDIAADLGAPRGPAWQLSTISQGSNLKERIMCILDPKIDRNRGRRRAGVVSCFIVAAIVLPLSISGVWRTQAQAQEKSDKEKKEAEFKKHEMMTKEKEMQLHKKMEGMSAEEREKFLEEQELKKEKSKISVEEKINLSWEKISQSENSAAVFMHDMIEKKGLERAEHDAQQLVESKSDEYYFKESEFNTLGYLYLYGKKIDEALAIFKLNVKMNPESWNVYDSLGEACLAAGKNDKARALYEKSLALNPDNVNGRKMLTKIDEKSGLAKVHESGEKDESE
jgi:beta-lactamase regulating signal transducer with metallopeptidase domain/predicted negative regulator of RcsB-dependent stress response